ncbi:PREDICTED: hemolymph lipopolysaccharide-binding protein [Dufourea novaeangliae]|uniref:hemolymph lipopolysaccharide-binding protein n=1 Tax=Dufourea novaeangliae TaxID=178035 RepID=UPI000766EC9B|nr:PREDICTED: hemolymph lipopolysaccharide-binding protein [Dufourea novaeangliae]
MYGSLLILLAIASEVLCAGDWNPSRSSLDTARCQNNYDAEQQLFYINSRNMGQSSTPMKEGYRITRGVGAHKLYTKKAKWNAVRKTCMMDGGHLVILNSLAEESVLMNLMQAANLDTIWVGAHDMFREGEWVTLTGESLERAGYEKWSTILPNQPDNHNGRENCGTLGRQGGINDEVCTLNYPFICEVDIY